MKINTSDLKGPSLRWAVSVALGDTPAYQLHKHSEGASVYRGAGFQQNGIDFRPDINWSHAGPIIDSESLLVGPSPFPGGEFAAGIGNDWDTCTNISLGSTYLEAAMRCVVKAHLGEEVDIPDDLAPVPVRGMKP